MTVIELVVATAIIFVTFAFSLPVIQSTITSYHLTEASSAVSGAIQSTRYQAIMRGCPYTIAFAQNTGNYQIGAQSISGTPPACAATFSDVGAPLPWTTSGDVNLGASTTLQLNPNGTVVATVGSLVLTLTNGAGTKTITVSGVGNVTATGP